MDITEQAFRELYPEREFKYNIELKYSDKFKDFNGNIRHYPMSRTLKIGLSKKWRTIDPEIRMGMIQELYMKILGGRRRTKYVDYYNIFMKKVHLAAPKLYSDPLLEESFKMLNEKFFFGNMEQPNLIFKGDSKSKLGSYEYGSDTINISLVMKDAPRELLDYVVYHEMLHKKIKFNNKNGKSFHHTPEFRESEAKFGEVEELEKRLGWYLASKRRTRKANFEKPSFLHRLFDF